MNTQRRISASRWIATSTSWSSPFYNLIILLHCHFCNETTSVFFSAMISCTLPWLQALCCELVNINWQILCVRHVHVLVNMHATYHRICTCMKRKEIEHELLQTTRLDDLLIYQHYVSIFAEFRCLEVACFGVPQT
jgi:hypothetical protein